MLRSRRHSIMHLAHQETDGGNGSVKTQSTYCFRGDIFVILQQFCATDARFPTTSARLFENYGLICLTSCSTTKKRNANCFFRQRCIAILCPASTMGRPHPPEARTWWNAKPNGGFKEYSAHRTLHRIHLKILRR